MTVAGYARVSTEDQSLERQLEGISNYARQELNTPLTEVEIYRDKSTGTDMARDGYQNLIASIENDDHDAVIVQSVSRISRSIRDLDRTAERLVEENGVELHIISEGFQFTGDESDPYQKALFRLLGVFAELEADLAQKRTREGIAARQNDPAYHHGPAPLGFEKNSGRLVEADEYDQVVTVLEMVQKGELSKRKAAQELASSRATINRALERKELYGLQI